MDHAWTSCNVQLSPLWSSFNFPFPFQSPCAFLSLSRTQGEGKGKRGVERRESKERENCRGLALHLMINNYLDQRTLIIHIISLFYDKGTYLISGGEESVLVLWQLETCKKFFRSRLGSPIKRISCCQGDSYFTVSLQSNGLCIVHVCVRVLILMCYT